MVNIPKKTIVDSITFDTKAAACEYLAQKDGITFNAAKSRIDRGTYGDRISYPVAVAEIPAAPAASSIEDMVAKAVVLALASMGVASSPVVVPTEALEEKLAPAQKVPDFLRPRRVKVAAAVRSVPSVVAVPRVERSRPVRMRFTKNHPLVIDGRAYASRGAAAESLRASLPCRPETAKAIINDVIALNKRLG